MTKRRNGPRRATCDIMSIPIGSLIANTRRDSSAIDFRDLRLYLGLSEFGNPWGLYLYNNVIAELSLTANTYVLII